MANLPGPENKKTGNFFSKIGNLLSWVASRIALDAKREEKKQVSLQEKKIAPLSSHKSRQELAFQAKNILRNLEAFKEQLLKDFGQNAQSFVAKSITPMIENMYRLVAEQTGAQEHAKQEGEFSEILVQVVQSVELYSQIKDEKKLRHKIMSEAIMATKQAVEKDFQVLRNYQHLAIQDMDTDQKSLIKILDRKLEPVFRELGELAHTDIRADDLQRFFDWKKEVDEKRGALIELGFLTIDTLLERSSSTTAKEVEELESSLIARSYELVKLANLEEKVLKIFELLENRHVCNHKIIHEIEHMLSDLKGEAESYQVGSLGSEDEKGALEGSFQDLYESILKAEMLLEHRKCEAFKKQK